MSYPDKNIWRYSYTNYEIININNFIININDYIFEIIPYFIVFAFKSKNKNIK